MENEYGFHSGFMWDLAILMLGFSNSLIRVHKKVSMTKNKIGSKDAEWKMNMGFIQVSCRFQQY